MTPAEMLDAAMEGALDVDGGAEHVEQPTDEENQEQQAEQVAAGEGQPNDSAAGNEPEGAPIASKSGAYTIPYQKLVDARTDRDAWKQRAEQLEAQVQSLSTQQQANLASAQQDAQNRADAGQAPTQADQNLALAQAAVDAGVDVSIFGDFSEEALAAGIKTMNLQMRDELRAELKAEIAKELAPLKQREQQSEAQAHLNAIYEAHPDASEVVESAQFQAWRDAQPSFMRASIDQVLKGGTTEQVIEVFDSFKAGSGQAPRAQKPAALDVPRRVPASLSEVAGAAPVDETLQLNQLANNPQALMDRFAGMTPEQIDAAMDRVA